MARFEDDDLTTPVLLVGADGVIQRANVAAQRLLGACVGLPCRSVVRPRDDDAEIVCHHGCPRGEKRDACWREIQTRDKLGTLRCTGLGDVVVVTLGGLVEPPGVRQRLTAREREVLTLLARGLATPGVAEILGIGRSTVRTHVEHCRTKLGAATQAEAVAKALATHQVDF